MASSCPIALACSGHYSLSNLLGSFSQRWCLLGLPFGYPSLRFSSAAIPLGHDFAWWGAPPLRWGFWTCLSRAVDHGSSPWLLVVVTIERISTMQLFFQEAIIWLAKLRMFQQTLPTNDIEKSPVSHRTFACPKQYLNNKKRRPNRDHRSGVSQIPSEGQVRTSSQL